jgi:hypothetical protein
VSLSVADATPGKSTSFTGSALLMSVKSSATCFRLGSRAHGRAPRNHTKDKTSKNSPKSPTAGRHTRGHRVVGGQRQDLHKDPLPVWPLAAAQEHSKRPDAVLPVHDAVPWHASKKHIRDASM